MKCWLNLVRRYTYRWPFKLNGGTPLMKTTWHGPAHSPLCPAPPAYTHATADGDYRQKICRGQRSTLKAPQQAVFSSLILFAPLRSLGWVGGGRSYAWGLGTTRRDARRVLERHKEVDEAGWQRTLLLIRLFSSPREYCRSSPLYGEVPRWITGMHASRQGQPTCVRGKAWQWAQGWTMLRRVRVCVQSLNVRTAASPDGFSVATGGWGLVQWCVWQVLRCKALH